MALQWRRLAAWALLCCIVNYQYIGLPVSHSTKVLERVAPNKVRPVISANPVNNSLQISLSFDTSSIPLPTNKFDITFESNDFADFLSPHFILARQSIIKESDEDYIEEHRTDGDDLEKGNSSELIEQLFDYIDNGEDDEVKSSQPTNCHLYTGQINAEPLTTATFSICPDGQLSGIISWPSLGHLLLEPENDPYCQSQLIQTVDFNVTSEKLQSCTHQVQFISDRNSVSSRQPRSKRSVSLPRTIEVMVVTHISMWLTYGESVQQYVMAQMASVHHFFKQSSVGNQINVKLMKLHIIKDEVPDDVNYFEGSTADDVLTRFCRWQQRHNPVDDSDRQHHDIAILFTKQDLCLRNKNSTQCNTIGLTRMGKVCTEGGNCLIVEDIGLSTFYTIVHEMGHVLGIPHDGSEKCRQFYAERGQLPQLNVMAPSVDAHHYVWTWSACSQHYLTQFLDSGKGACLLDDNAQNMIRSEDQMNEASGSSRMSRNHRGFNRLTRTKQAGEYYTVDAQCQLVFGKSYRQCFWYPQYQCKQLWCSHANNACRSSMALWADGTECLRNDTEVAWCQAGECVPKNASSMLPIDGGWGEWSEWSDCSMDCDGGIRKATRKCDNPSPQNGGAYCLGERIRYQSCNTQPCNPPSVDAREMQCSQLNGKNVKENVGTDVTWYPMITEDPELQCKLYCTENTTGEFVVEDQVIDGTPCAPDSFDICVNGKCLNAGCDGILGSTIQLDSCGNCGGDNSTCRQISKHIPAKFGSYGYNYVVQFPAGATNITLEKGPLRMNESLLAIKDDEGNYLLNGNFRLTKYDRKIYYDSAAIEYSGAMENNTERIIVKRPISRALQIEVFATGEMLIPDIWYTYWFSFNVASVSRFEWLRFDTWSKCDQICNGKEEKKVICIQVQSSPKEEKYKVADKHCQHLPRPNVHVRPCNVNCEVKWHVGPFGDCDQTCGSGVRLRQVNCTRKIGDVVIHVEDRYCARLKRKPHRKESCSGTDCPWSNWSKWSQCTYKVGHCQGGYTIREPLCPVGLQCRLETKPEPFVNSCNVDCPYSKWVPLEWTPCSVTCGYGKRTRTVQCRDWSGRILEHHMCSRMAKPSETKRCYMPSCKSNWETKSWSGWVSFW